jgi:hypothetical protein
MNDELPADLAKPRRATRSYWPVIIIGALLLLLDLGRMAWALVM